jgi:hypothetical protein
MNTSTSPSTSTAENLNSILGEILEFTAENKGILKITKTMLDKSIIDANQSIRQLARLFGVDYDDMQPMERVRIPYISSVSTSESSTVVTFYKTARGDRRISIQKIKEIAGEGDTLSLMWARNESGELILIIKGE